jgi:hypothetical protein
MQGSEKTSIDPETCGNEMQYSLNLKVPQTLSGESSLDN